MMKMNQPPKDLVEGEVLEHEEDVLLFDGVGDLGEGHEEDHFNLEARNKLDFGWSTGSIVCGTRILVR